MNPKVLLLDEVTSNLDPELIGEVNKTAKKLAKEGYSIVLVSHDLGFVKEISDRVLFLHDGKILEGGKPSQIFGRPREKRTREFLKRILK